MRAPKVVLPIVASLLLGACQAVDGAAGERALVLQCTVSVTFAAGSSTLSPDAQRELDTFVKSCGPGLNDSAATLVIEGYANRTGPAERNTVISQQRVAAVRSYLFDAKLSAQKIELETYGDTRSSASGGDRRVSVFVKWDS